MTMTKNEVNESKNQGEVDEDEEVWPMPGGSKEWGLPLNLMCWHS